MEHTVILGPATHEMPLVQTAFAPFHNIWMRTAYFLHGSFDLDILTLDSYCTSGSPVVASGFRMGGFLTPAGGRVTSDGKTVVFHIPEGQKLLAIEGGEERKQWALYNSLVEAPAPESAPRQSHWLAPEYVTWVEQKSLAAEKGGN